MKKLFFSLIFIISFSSIWAVWEGNGGIGAASDFPDEGLFARSDMFPKHTLLEITNLEKNITVRAVVMGQSGIPGLLVSLSPELGAKLEISPGKVVRVRVLTPSPVQEIGDDGFSAGSSAPESMDLDSNPALFVAGENIAPDINMEPAVSEVPKAENDSPELIVNTEPPAEPPIDPVEEIVAEKPAEEVVPQVEEEPKEESQNAPLLESVVADKPDEVVAPAQPQIVPEVRVYMEPADSRPPIIVPGISEPKKVAKENVKEVKEVDGIVEPPVKTEEPAPVVAVAEPDAPKQPVISDEPPVSVVDAVIEPKKDVPVPDDAVDYIAPINQPKSERPEEPEEKVESVEPIIQPQAEPVSEEREKPVEIPETEEIVEPVTPVEEVVDGKTSEDIYEIAEQPEPVKPVKPVKPVEPVEIAKSIPLVEEPVLPVKPEKLKKGELYIQIAVYNDKSIADSAVQKYGKQYPIVIEETEKRGKPLYTVFVGPLQHEETGAVIERFKYWGFKDAFLKKVK